MKTELQDTLDCHGSYQPYRDTSEKGGSKRTMFLFHTLAEEWMTEQNSSKWQGIQRSKANALRSADLRTALKEWEDVKTRAALEENMGDKSEESYQWSVFSYVVRPRPRSELNKDLSDQWPNTSDFSAKTCKRHQIIANNIRSPHQIIANNIRTKPEATLNRTQTST